MLIMSKQLYIYLDNQLKLNMSYQFQVPTSNNTKNNFLQLILQPQVHHVTKSNDHHKKKNFPRRMTKWNGYYGTRVNKSPIATP